MQGVYNIETSDYRYMSREALIAAAEHNRQSAAYMNKLYQQEKQKNSRIDKHIEEKAKQQQGKHPAGKPGQQRTGTAVIQPAEVMGDHPQIKEKNQKILKL